MKLFVTRHGQAEDNVRGITMGQRGSKLTALGVRQAERKTLELKKLSQKIDRIYTSDLGRCIQTAQIISDTVGLHEATSDKDLREISFGKYEGLPYDAIPHIEGGYMKVRFPDGESNEIMATRVIDAVNRIYEVNKDACVLIVTHSGPIAAIFASYYGKDMEEMLENKIDNNRVVELQVDRRLDYPIYAK
jgi:broad specificity phosphatase PhoE